MAQSGASYSALAAEAPPSEKTVNVVQGTAVAAHAQVTHVTQTQPYMPAQAVAVQAQVVQPNGAPHVNVYSASGQGPIISQAGYLLPPGPMNQWEDGLCACCSDCGACCMVAFFPCIPLAQLYERIIKAGTFMTLLIGFAIVYLLQRIAFQYAYGYNYGGYDAWSQTTKTSVLSAVNLGVSLAVLFVLMQVRNNVRRHYNIPEQSCQGCEDCCCAWWCGACVMCQIMRHVNDYSGTRTTGCQCSETGMPTDFNPQVWYGNVVGTNLHRTGQNPSLAFLV